MLLLCSGSDPRDLFGHRHRQSDGKGGDLRPGCRDQRNPFGRVFLRLYRRMRRKAGAGRDLFYRFSSCHPQGEEIKAFLKGCGVLWRELTSGPLLDVGSLIPLLEDG